MFTFKTGFIEMRFFRTLYSHKLRRKQSRLIMKTWLWVSDLTERVPAALGVNSLSRPKHDAQLDYYSRRLATASSDHTIKIFDIDGDSQRLVETLTG